MESCDYVGEQKRRRNQFVDESILADYHYINQLNITSKILPGDYQIEIPVCK